MRVWRLAFYAALALAAVLPASSTSATGDGWTSKAPMLTARNAHASAVVGGKIYAIGGHDVSPTRLSSVEMYDPILGTWTYKAPMPAPRAYLAAAAVNDKIYVIGGYDGVGFPAPVLEYDPATDTWSTKSNLPTPRAGLALAVVDGMIYVFGGDDSSGLVTDVERYDPATDAWQSKSPMPGGRRAPAATAVGGMAYVLGGCLVSCGYDGTDALASTLRYDPVNDVWSERALMPTARWVLAAVTLNGRIYAIGGLGNHAMHFRTVEEYDPIGNVWATRASMLHLRQALTAVPLAGTIYAIGGHNRVLCGTSGAV